MSLREVLVGIDSGQTVGKVAVYDTVGTQLSAAAAPTVTVNPHPQWAERDMTHLWAHLCTAIRAALTRAAEATGGSLKILGVGVCGHNDGAYPVGAHGQPIRPGILATDGRALTLARTMAEDESGSALLELTGQLPFAATSAAIYRWMRTNEPNVFHQVRWALFCKDWIRLCLTGEVATDRTDASSSFTDARTGFYSELALALYDLPELAHRLPPIRGCTEIAGTVTPQAAALSGLPQGTPVIVGAHDVDAAALGIGAIEDGSASIILGTFSINQIMATRPVRDRRWQARPFMEPGQWLHMSTSPAGAANLDWAIRQLGPLTPSGDPDPALATKQAFAAAISRSEEHAVAAPLFVPFLYGAPHGHTGGAAWYGLRGWHGRNELLMAVLEGVVFNHRTHLASLREVFVVRDAVRVCGGGARSTNWTQLLSDALDLPVEVTDAEEAGARGGAMLAGIGAGVFSDLADAVATCVRVVRRQEPDDHQTGLLVQRYRRYQHLVTSLDHLGA